MSDILTEIAQGTKNAELERRMAELERRISGLAGGTPNPPASADAHNEIWKEMRKWGALAVIQLVVLFGAVWVVVNPVVNSINEKATAQMRTQATIENDQTRLTKSLSEQKLASDALSANVTAAQSRMTGFDKQLDAIIDPTKQAQAQAVLKAVSTMVKENPGATKLMSDIQAIKDRFRFGSTKLKAGATRIDIGNPVNGALWFVRIDGDQYDHRYLLAVAHNGYGLPGEVHIISVIRQFEYAEAAHRSAYGAPTFSVDKDGALSIGGRNYPDGVLNLSYSMIDSN